MLSAKSLQSFVGSLFLLMAEHLLDLQVKQVSCGRKKVSRMVFSLNC
jgi:hypothetical protein